MWDVIRSNRRKSAALILLLAGVLMGMGWAIGTLVDPRGGLVGVLAAVVVWLLTLATAFVGGEKILLAQAGAREITSSDNPRLFHIVEEMQLAAGLPVPPRVHVIDNPVPNAFAVGLKPERAAVAVTTGLLARLNRDELQGVIAHEVGHIANRDTLFMTLAGVTVGAVVTMADLFFRGLRFGGLRTRRSGKGGGGAAGLLMIVALVLAILAPIVAQLLYFACSRRREFLADASAAQFTRYPEGLASALEKISKSQAAEGEVDRVLTPMYIVSPLAARGSSLSLWSTHPPTQDRIRVLRGISGDSSLAAYEAAYQSLHGGKGVISPAGLQASAAVEIRPPVGEEPASAGAPARRWREAREAVNRLDGLRVIPCACGVRLKLPPAYAQPTVACPRCGAVHAVAG